MGTHSQEYRARMISTQVCMVAGDSCNCSTRSLLGGNKRVELPAV